MRKALSFILAAGFCIGSYATDARVISMGKHDAFFMDEQSVFRNPANLSLYPNMIYGSLGKFNLTDSGSILKDPFFGAIVSYSLKEEAESAGKYPMVSFGAMLNRYDEMLDYVTRGTSRYLDTAVDLKAPVGKMDLMMGYVTQKGVMMGAGAYLAMQEVEEDNALYETKVYKGNIGMNWPVAKTMDLEISMGGGTITARSDDKILAEQDYFGRFEIRLFSAMAGVNGKFVPRARVDVLQLEKLDQLNVDIAAGLGINLNIDKGFFWGGLEFLYGQRDLNDDESLQDVGGRISFGIERNVVWDWLVVRAGGQKNILVRTEGPDRKSFVENIASDDSDGDLISFGFGINIENRLRLDFVASENIPYTFSNLISGDSQRYLFNRFSCTYAF